MFRCPKRGTQIHHDTNFSKRRRFFRLYFLLHCWRSRQPTCFKDSSPGYPAFSNFSLCHRRAYRPFSLANILGTTGGVISRSLFSSRHPWAPWCSSLYSLVFYRSGSPLGYRQALFLVLPVTLIFLAMTQAKTNIGLRHILPVYPFLLVLASRTATLRLRRPSLALLLIGIPLACTAISSLRIAPHQLAYFNESIGGPEQGYRYLSDSNLDWGQDLKGLKAYIEREKLPIIYLSYFGTAPPAYYGIRYQDVASKGALGPPPPERVPADAPRKILAISAYNLQDVSKADNPLFRWLWTRRPIAKIGYSIFVYDLTNDQEGIIKLEEIYVKPRSP